MIILVDGYNVIHRWNLLGRYKDSIDIARERFLNILSNYQAYTGYRIIIVFDRKGALPLGRESYPPNLEVIFSSVGQSADTYIERFVYRADNPGEIMVVTDDSMEALTVRNMGAKVVSTGVFKRMIQGQDNRKGMWRDGING